MKKAFITVAGIALSLVQLPLFAAEEEIREFSVSAFSASDPGLELVDDSNCAVVLKELLRFEQYRLVSSASVQGPPGVVYTLEGPRGDIVILKCSTQGHESGGGCSEGLAE